MSDIRVLMIYNNAGNDERLTNAWGLSLWLEHKDWAVLFDTGGDSSVLWNNIKTLNLDISKLQSIMISHNHWDHINGLSFILEKTSYQPVVYVPAADFESIKQEHHSANIKEITNAQKINEFLWTTGQLEGETGFGSIHEQGLILTYNDNIYLFTGCSHPGIYKMAVKTKEVLPHKTFQMVAGGFHLINYSKKEVKDLSGKLKDLQIEKIAPSHCTGDSAIQIFRELWGEDFVEFGNGQLLNVY